MTQKTYTQKMYSRENTKHIHEKHDTQFERLLVKHQVSIDQCKMRIRVLLNLIKISRETLGTRTDYIAIDHKKPYQRESRVFR